MDPDLRPQTTEPTNPELQPDLPQHNPALGLNKKQRKSRKKIWLFIGIPVVLILALVAAFWFYYSNPNRVLGDVVKQFNESKSSAYDGTVIFNGKGENQQFAFTSQFNGQQSETSGQLNTTNEISAGAVDINVDLSVITSENEAYIKLDNAGEVGDMISAMAGGGPEIEALLPLFDELEGNWVGLSNDSGEQLGVDAQCDNKKVSDWLSNEKQTFRDLFNDHQFIKAERAGGFSLTELHYSLTFDHQIAQEFVNHVQELESYQQAKQDCPILDNFAFTMSQVPEVTGDIWVNTWTHAIKRVSLKLNDPMFDATLDAKLNLNTQIDIQIPSDSKTFEEIFNQFMEKQMEQQMGQLQTQMQ